MSAGKFACICVLYFNMFTFSDFVTVTVIGILLCFCTLVPSEGLGHSGNNADTSKKTPIANRHNHYWNSA